MVRISSPDKVMFPDAGYTKADLVGYYERASEPIAPHVVGRPLTLHRFPSGIGQKGFLQKNAAGFFPQDIPRVEIPKRDGTTTYAVLESGVRIPYLANLGTVTFHVWTATTADLARPDRLLFDLDPPEDGWRAAATAARLVRTFLGDRGVSAAVMTTGSKGYHVVAPIAPRHDYSVVGRLAQLVAAMLSAQAPEILTDEFRIANRGGRVFVDWLRNRAGQTGVSAWSVRARPGAPVATPLRWDELDDTPPDSFTIANAPDRFGIDSIVDLAATPNDIDAIVAQVAVEAAKLGVEPPQFDRFRS